MIGKKSLTTFQRLENKRSMSKTEKTENIFEQLIRSSNEGLTIEHKNYGNWEKDSVSSFLLIRSLLALANTPSGGYSIIGIKDNGSRVGLSSDVANSYKHDDISRVVKSYADPMIVFSMYPKSLEINDEQKTFIVFSVEESKETVICIKQGKINKSEVINSDNLFLRENAIYIRRGNPVESSEPKNSNEWRSFLKLKMSQRADEIREEIGMFCVPYTENQYTKQQNSDDDEFAKQRNSI